MRRAFTLIEMLIVVAIGIILIAIALPTIKYGMEDAKVREGARQVNAFFASAKAQATATGRPAGVWLELEKIGDPNAVPGVYQCSQLYLAEVQAHYAGDFQNALCRVEIGKLGTLADTPPWTIDFLNSAGMLNELVTIGEVFEIRLDNKSAWFRAHRTSAGYEILGPRDGVRPPRVPGPGPDGRPGVAGVDDNANGIVDGIDANGNLNLIDYEDELMWPGSDDRPRYDYSFEIRRLPQRVGQPLELPQGVVIDMAYSGLGLVDNIFRNAKERVLVMFGQQGGVSKVGYVDQTGWMQWDGQNSKLFLLLGRTEKIYPAWNTVPDSNLADGSNLWISVNRRTGSVATVENVPNATLPYSTLTERGAYLAAAREFAAKGDVKGGQ